MRHLRHYRAIKAIVDAGSIRKAAETLAISPSALNRSIQAFEAELGVDIFERLANGVRLSIPGELLLRPIIEHLAQIDDFQGLLSEMKGGQSGTLRLSMAQDLWPGLGQAVIDRFNRDHPGVAIEVSVDNGLTRLLDRSVDLALITVPATEPEADVLMSAALPVLGLVDADHPRAGQTMALSDVSDVTLLLPPQGCGVRQVLDVMLRRSGVLAHAQNVLPSLPTRLRPGPYGDLAFGLDPETSPISRVRGVDLAGLRLGDVQVTLVGRQGGYRPRAVDHFCVCVGHVLDRLTRETASP